jgi:putative transposase
VKLSFKFYPKFSPQQLEIIDELSYHTTKLYNIANYDCREDKAKSYVEMNSMYKANYHKEFLHSHTYQHCLKVLEKNWKSYFSGIRDFNKNPSKYLGIPRSPKFKNHDNKKNEVIFTNQSVRVKGYILMLSLAKAMQKKFQVQSLNFDLTKIKMPVDFTSLQQIRIKWDNSSKLWYLIIIYNKAETDITEGFNNVMGIDLGMDNLAAITFEQNPDVYIIDGKYAKSKNSYYNKEIARLTSVTMKQCKDSKRFKRTKALIRLQKSRNNFINDYIHKASRMVIDLAAANRCNTIVLGDFCGVKQNNTAKSFVQIPQQELVSKIKYKAKLLGITVIMQNESYTSGCSALDLEEVDKENYDKSRRISRGLFVSNNGLRINADVNGSLNILRKYLKCTPKSLTMMIMDNGLLNSPMRLRVA